ncbi:MAG: DNA-directed RNA polymerase subunit alpha [Patescibacteria group bacterium]
MINIPIAKKVEDKEIDTNKYSFKIGPLYPGYGLTLGNALRRTLLSSLGGAAIESVKIKGVDHEFSTVEWIKEDIVDIILNLKQVRIKISPEVKALADETGEPVKLNLHVKGEKDVTAKDFKKVGGIEIINPELKIATLTDAAANMEMEVAIGYGLGYLPVEERVNKIKEIGVIAIDAIYTPVKRVSYNIENVRVGSVTNWDELTLNIETDGTIKCKEAFEKSVKILISQFGALLNSEKDTEQKEKE